jgi:two-component system, OmpR family, sensor kinase
MARREDEQSKPRNERLPVPDWVLLRRFGLVRAVGGGAYIVGVLVLLAIFGWQVWPLALGVPVLAVVTTGYFLRSQAYPRASVIISLVADALVLGGAIGFLGGTGAGLIMLYGIVVVSAGILLGPATALAFTGFTIALSTLQLALEQVGLEPAVLHRPELGDRLPIFLVSVAGLASVGYLAAIYADRLHELISLAGEEAEAIRRRANRRRSFIRHARAGVEESLREVEAVAEALDEHGRELADGQRQRLAARLRIGVTHLDAEIDQLAEVGVMDETGSQLHPVRLARVVDDCVAAQSQRLSGHVVDVDVGEVKVVADRRVARRVVYNLLDNAAEHTPAGTHVSVKALKTGSHAVLVVTDTGPGIPPERAERLFEPPDDRSKVDAPRVGLPLVRELAASMGAEVRYEPAPDGGSRFLVSFRLAPAGAPTQDDETHPPGEIREASEG